jgi:hypothetical protein
VAKGVKSPAVTDPGLVMKTMRILNAKVEELQQDVLQAKKNLSYREILEEKRFKEQEKQINAQKRKRCDSRSAPSCANSATSAKQAKQSSSSGSKKKLPPASSKASGKSSKTTVNILTASAVSEALEEVLIQAADTSMEGFFKASLPTRGEGERQRTFLQSSWMTPSSTISRRVVV